MLLRSWLEQNADSGGSMNAKSHITTFKWRHINAFPVHLSSNNSLEQCAVHAHEIVFFSREAWTVLPWRAFWIGVLNQRFKTLNLPSQNKHERSHRGGMSRNAVGMKILYIVYSWIFEVHSKILTAFQIFGPILVAGPNVLLMLKTFEVHSKWREISNGIRSVF